MRRRAQRALGLLISISMTLTFLLSPGLFRSINGSETVNAAGTTILYSGHYYGMEWQLTSDKVMTFIFSGVSHSYTEEGYGNPASHFDEADTVRIISTDGQKHTFSIYGVFTKNNTTVKTLIIEENIAITSYTLFGIENVVINSEDATMLFFETMPTITGSHVDCLKNLYIDNQNRNISVSDIPSTVKDLHIECTDRVSSIDLSGNTSLEDLTIYGEGINNIVFPSTANWSTISIYNTAISDIQIPSGIELIGTQNSNPNATMNSHPIISLVENSELETVSIPSTVTGIEYGAFRDCSSLKTLAIPATVTSIVDTAVNESSINTINYSGTSNQWNQISIGHWEKISEELDDFDPSSFRYVPSGLDPDIAINYVTPAPTTSAPTAAPSTTAPTSAPTTTVPTTTPVTSTPTAAPTSSPTTPNPTAAPGESTSSGVGGFVERLYTVALGRSSDPAGQQQWVDTITSGQNSGADVARGFLYSPEFLNKNSTNEEFVSTLYRTFFGREADGGGLAAWVGVLDGGESRQNVIEGFINSTEWANLCLSYGIPSGGTGTPNIDVEPNQATIDFATRLYTTCLNRNADQGGLMAWARQLANQRDTGTGAARGFFFSAEFANQNVDNGEFVTRLYRTFMGREPDQAGYNAWVGQLDQGVSREEVFNGFAQSQEFTAICAQYGIVRGS